MRNDSSCPHRIDVLEERWGRGSVIVESTYPRRIVIGRNMRTDLSSFMLWNYIDFEYLYGGVRLVREGGDSKRYTLDIIVNGGETDHCFDLAVVDSSGGEDCVERRCMKYVRLFWCTFEDENLTIIGHVDDSMVCRVYVQSDSIVMSNLLEESKNE